MPFNYENQILITDTASHASENIFETTILNYTMVWYDDRRVKDIEGLYLMDLELSNFEQGINNSQ